MSNMLRLARLQHVALQDNEPHQFAQRHALKIFAKPNSWTVYSFIPKNACTTMRYSLAIANGCIKSPEDFEWIHKNNFVFSANISELVAAARSFVILRCPYSRLASVFLDKVVSKSPPSHLLKNLLPDLQDVSELTFREFAKAMQNEKVRKANSHWRNQSDFLVYENYTRYFSLENFRQDISAIEYLSSMKIHDARRLSKHGTDRYEMITEGKFCDMTAENIDSLKNAGKIPSHASLYDAEIIEDVTRAYFDDISLYLYHFDASNLLFPTEARG